MRIAQPGSCRALAKESFHTSQICGSESQGDVRKEYRGAEVGWSCDNAASNQCLSTQNSFGSPVLSGAAVIHRDNAAESCGCAHDVEKAGDLCPD